MSDVQPQSIDMNSQGLNLTWSDGVSCELGARLLRAACNCAHCVSEITGERLIDDTKISPEITLTAGQPSGNYALVLTFSDGHNTGIYTYEYLKQLGERA